MQLFLQFLDNPFQTLQDKCYNDGLEICMCFFSKKLIYVVVFSILSHFNFRLFSDSKYCKSLYEVGTLWAQLLLKFLANSVFETLYD